MSQILTQKKMVGLFFEEKKLCEKDYPFKIYVFEVYIFLNRKTYVYRKICIVYGQMDGTKIDTYISIDR